jgi:hypothetical protein
VCCMGLCFCTALVEVDTVDIAALYCIYLRLPCKGVYKVRGDLFFRVVKEDLLGQLCAVKKHSGATIQG